MVLTTPSVKYLQLILMNLTVEGLSSSELGDSWRQSDLADTLFEIPFCTKSRRGGRKRFHLCYCCDVTHIQHSRQKTKYNFLKQICQHCHSADPSTDSDIALTCETLSDTPFVEGESDDTQGLFSASVWTPSGTKSF